MPCNYLISESGKIIGVACSRGKNQKKCYICGKPAVSLCDYPGCDKPMCREHSHRIGYDNDVCKEHFNDVSIQKAKKERERLEKNRW